jgi:hypothetical protein
MNENSCVIKHVCMVNLDNEVKCFQIIIYEGPNFSKVTHTFDIWMKCKLCPRINNRTQSTLKKVYSCSNLFGCGNNPKLKF